MCNLSFSQLDASRFEELEEVNAELQLKELLWTSTRDWDAMYNDWLETPFDYVDPDEFNVQVSLRHFKLHCDVVLIQTTLKIHHHHFSFDLGSSRQRSWQDFVRPLTSPRLTISSDHTHSLSPVQSFFLCHCIDHTDLELMRSSVRKHSTTRVIRICFSI